WDSGGSILYGSEFSGFAGSVYTMGVDAGGIETTSTMAGVTGGPIHLANGLIYLEDGSIFDPAHATVDGTFTHTANLYGILPDAASGRLFVFSGLDSPVGAVQIQSYDLQTHAPIAMISLPQIASQAIEWKLWGTNGIIIRTAY